MAKSKLSPKKISIMTNTKQEMVEAYDAIVKQFQEESEVKLKPREKIKEREIKEVVEAAEVISSRHF